MCLLIALALVPAFIHGYVGTVAADGRDTSLVPTTLAGFTSTPSGRNATWGKRRFESDDWIERRYVSGSDDVVLTVVRSYDLKALYHHPELAVAYGTPFAHHETMRLPQHPEIPVHVLRSDGNSDAVGLYVLHYDGRFVDDPIRFQIRTAGELLFNPRKPMTLFFIKDGGIHASSGDVGQLPSVPLLFAAVDRFVAGGPARQGR